MWLDGSKGGGSSSRPAPSTSTPTANTRDATSGPKQSDTEVSVSSLLQDTAEMLGFGDLAKKTKDLLEVFTDLEGGVGSLLGKSKSVAEAPSVTGPRESIRATSGPSVVDVTDIATGEQPDLGKMLAKGAELEKSLPPIPNPTTAARAATAVEGTTASTATTAGASVESLVTGASAAGPALAGVAAVAIPLTAALAAVVAGVAAFKLGLEQAYADIEALEGYSPELSNANAMAEVRTMMAEMRRADRLGPQLAELSDITSRGQEALYDIGTELMSVFLDYAEEMKPFIEASIVAAKITAAAIPAMKEQMDLMISLWSPLAAFMLGLKDPLTEAKEAVDAIKKFTKKTAEALENKPDEVPVNDPFIDELFKGIFGLGNPNPVPPMPPAPGPNPKGGGFF